MVGAAALIVVGIAEPAAAAAVRVRWQPSADPRVIGYRVYVREAGHAYAAPEDAGMPGQDDDGTLDHVVEDLAIGTPYRFALTAYTDDGTESVLSDELALGPVNPCVVDRCTTPTHCEFGVVPDGTPCGVADRDPCTAAAVCSHAQCPTPVGADLGVQDVRLAATAKQGRLVARAFAVPTRSIDATISGVALEAASSAGTILYRAVVPASGISSNHRRTHFWYIAATSSKHTAAGGIRWMDARVKGDKLFVTVRAMAHEIVALMMEPRLTWVLRIGEECARHLDVYCTRDTRGIVSCS